VEEVGGRPCSEETETLSALMARTDKAMQDINSLHPSTFTLDDLDKELLCMTLIRDLPTEFDHFASSLLLMGIGWLIIIIQQAIGPQSWTC
jgi:hypothetical protein